MGPWEQKPASSQAARSQGRHLCCGSTPRGLRWEENPHFPSHPLRQPAHAQPGPLVRGQAAHPESLVTWPTRGSGGVLWGKPAAPHLPGRGCGQLREPRVERVSNGPAPWVGSPGSPSNEVTLLVHRTPIRVWVEKAVDRLEPGKEMRRSGLPGCRCCGGKRQRPSSPPTYRVGSCWRLKPPTFTTLCGFSGPP